MVEGNAIEGVTDVAGIEADVCAGKDAKEEDAEDDESEEEGDEEDDPVLSGPLGALGSFGSIVEKIGGSGHGVIRRLIKVCWQYSSLGRLRHAERACYFGGRNVEVAAILV